MSDVPKRFEATQMGTRPEVWRRSPHGDVLVATCHTIAWARTIAELLNRDDANMHNPVMR